MGYDMPTTAAPGSQVTATLYWLSTHTEAAQLCAGENCFPIKVRAGNQVTETRVTFPAPNEAGVLRLRVGVAADFAECGWWPTPPVETCKLASISVEGAALAPNAINFDNKIVLDSITVETPEASPGGTVIVTARWRGLKPMDEDFTAFDRPRWSRARASGRVAGAGHAADDTVADQRADCRSLRGARARRRAEG
jgi:hypothetical protein